jgi:hypothetical protein
MNADVSTTEKIEVRLYYKYEVIPLIMFEYTLNISESKVDR